MRKKINKSLFLLGCFSPMLALAIPQVNKADHTVKAWAEAVKNRDGKAQYQLLCPGQKKKYYNELKRMNWVTGISSPQIGSYKIERVKAKNGQFKQNLYNIHYQIKLGLQSAGIITDRIRANGCVQDFKLLSPTTQCEPKQGVKLNQNTQYQCK